MLNVLVVGLGGVGTMASYALEKSGQAKVTAVLRSNFTLVQANGFNIDSVDYGTMTGWSPSVCCPDISSVSTTTAFDFIFITTKCHPSTVPSIIASITPLVTPGKTSLLLLQNGLGIEAPFAEAFPSTPVLSGISMIGARLTTPNTVLHEDPDCWKLGAFLHHEDTLPAATQTAAAKTLADVYNAGLADAMAKGTGAGCVLVDDVVAARWRKLLWNGTYNTLCTLLRMSVGELLSSPGKTTLLEPAMKEMAAIGRAAGYAKAVTDAVVEDMLTGTSMDSPFRPSMLVDLEKGRPFELEVILAAPLQVARDVGVDTPVLDGVYALLSVVLWKVTQE